MNPRLAANLLALLPQRPRIIDLQSDGTLFTHLAPRIGRSQVWTLIHTEEEVLETTLEEIAAWAHRRGLTVTVPAAAMLIHAPGGAWRIEGLMADLEAPDLVDYPKHDAMVCAGLLDRVDRQWIEMLAEVLDTPLLATALPRGVPDFLPRDRRDGALATAWRRAAHDMLFGAAPPHDPAATLRASLAPRGWTTLRAPSDEIVPRHALNRLRALMDAQRDTAAALCPGRTSTFESWHKLRLRQALAGRLAVQVGQEDVLAVPPRPPASAQRSR